MQYWPHVSDVLVYHLAPHSEVHSIWVTRSWPVYVCKYLYIYIYIYMYAEASEGKYIYIHIYVYIYICIHTSEGIFTGDSRALETNVADTDSSSSIKLAASYHRWWWWWGLVKWNNTNTFWLVRISMEIDFVTHFYVVIYQVHIIIIIIIS
jgi:hypothetical protein